MSSDELDDDEDDRTPSVLNPCPQCGRTMVVIGMTGVPAPEANIGIWETTFKDNCVMAPRWRWCSIEGDLHVRVPRVTRE